MENIKPLVVYIVQGNKHFFKWQCNNSIRTLKDIGKYDGDIVVLSDNKLNWDDFNFSGFKHLPCLKRGGVYTQRIHIDEYINVTNYSHIIYLDVDTLFYNKICPLFENKIVTFVEEQHIFKNIPLKTLEHTFFMGEEKENYKDKNAINAGQFLVPSKFYTIFFNKWREILGTYDGWGYDQSSFNSLILGNYFPSFNETRIQLFTEHVKDETIFCHYHCCSQLLYRFKIYKRECEKLISDCDFSDNLLVDIKLRE